MLYNNIQGRSTIPNLKEIRSIFFLDEVCEVIYILQLFFNFLLIAQRIQKSYLI
jgi:hypothetical protein